MASHAHQMNAIPPDRGAVATEQLHPASGGFDRLTAHERVVLMADDHTATIDAVRAASRRLAGFIDALADRMRNGGRLIYVGAGTSGRLGVLDASECPPTFQSDPGQVIGIIAGGDAALRASSETREDDPHGACAELDAIDIGVTDTVLGIAAGGTTPYVLGGIEYAHRRAAMTALLTCAALNATPVGCDHLIALDTGPEILAGSTRLKAGSATKLALNIITTSVFAEIGKVHGNLMIDLRATNDKLHDRAIRIMQRYAPLLDRADAAEVIAAAGGSLKTAIVMQKQCLSRDDAIALLDQHGGQLRRIIEPHGTTC